MGREANVGLWRHRVEAFERSGLSRRVWCARAGIAVSTLDVWRRRLRNTAAPTLVPIVVAPPADRTVAAASIEVEAGARARRLHSRADRIVEAACVHRNR